MFIENLKNQPGQFWVGLDLNVEMKQYSDASKCRQPCSSAPLLPCESAFNMYGILKKKGNSF